MYEDYGMGGGSIPALQNLEGSISNIVGQIDPQTIVDNLDHAFKGEQWNKEEKEWKMNEADEPLINNECRAATISYLDGILTNNTTMGTLDPKRLSFLMETVITTITREFVVNLEKFGFVPPGPEFDKKIYYNIGSPNTARMTLVSHMVYKVCFLVFSRALGGNESKRIFKSLSMSDSMGFGGTNFQQEKKSGWIGKMFGR